MHVQKRIILILRYIVITATSLVVLAPILWTFVSTIRPRSQLMSTRIFPSLSDLTPMNYIEVFNNNTFILFLKNSFFYSSSAAFIALLIGVFAAYSFSRINFRFKQQILTGFIVIMMIPVLVVLMPLYMMFSRINLLNPTGLIMIYAAGNIPFCVWLLKTFIDSIPREIDEAAHIDGCTKLQTLWHISLPLSRTGLASAFIIVFVNTWNELMYADTFLNKMELKPVTSGIMLWKSSHGTDWAGMNTAAMVACIPVVIIFFLLQDYFVNGLVAGAVKG